MNNDNLLIVLRGIAHGHKTIFADENDAYISKQCDTFQTKSWVEGKEEKSIESRLKYELYGEYPLSENNELDWLKNIKPAFNFNLEWK